jgi:hypothetical protein
MVRRTLVSCASASEAAGQMAFENGAIDCMNLSCQLRMHVHRAQVEESAYARAFAARSRS